MRRMCVFASMVMFRVAVAAPEPIKSWLRDGSGKMLTFVLRSAP